MKILSFALLFSSLFYFASCSEADNVPNESEKSENTENLETNSPIIIDSESQSSSALNPAHGEPGHRCEIAVGAPLNSEPTNQPNMPTEIHPELISPQPFAPTTEKVQVAKGMNPPHGEPGHVCEIAVGAPLN